MSTDHRLRTAGIKYGNTGGRKLIIVMMVLRISLCGNAALDTQLTAAQHLVCHQWTPCASNAGALEVLQMLVPQKLLVSSKCYYQRQLRVVSHCLTHQSTLTLVHAFVTSCIDCCSSLLVGLPLGTLARLEQILRSAARLVGRLPKFSSITSYMRDVLHWVPISQQIQYRITAMVSWCVLHCNPSQLCDLCCPMSVLAAHQVLRSAARGELLVPWTHLATVQRKAFSVVGLSAWNDLPVELRVLLLARTSKFYVSLKSFFGRDWAGSASEQQCLEEVLYKSPE